MWPNSRHSFTKRCFWKKRHFFRNRGTCTTFNHQWFPNVFFCWRVRSLRHGSFVRVTPTATYGTTQHAAIRTTKFTTRKNTIHTYTYVLSISWMTLIVFYSLSYHSRMFEKGKFNRNLVSTISCLFCVWFHSVTSKWSEAEVNYQPATVSVFFILSSFTQISQVQTTFTQIYVLIMLNVCVLKCAMFSDLNFVE